MGYVKIESFIWVLSTLCTASLCVGFNPSDKYLIDCGSPTNTPVGDRVFVSDESASKFLSTPQDVLASTNLKSITASDDSPLYQTARIFTEASKYSFPISEHGRHWIRLYFFPFDYQTYNMGTAKFGVSTEEHVLLSDFTAGFVLVKEYSVNVASDTLVIVFTPSGNSFAFVNAVEVVSAPDSLIANDAPSVTGKTFDGLLSQALETVVRVNMGGPTVLFENDTVWRTWVPDQDFLLTKNGIKHVSNIRAVKYPNGGATPDIAPRTVYGTATAMDADDDPNNNYNVTWEFSVEMGFRYLVRLHFCDIVSPGLNQLYFNVYVDSWIVATDLDLSQLAFNVLATALYLDYVTVPAVRNKLRVSIGPSMLPTVDRNAILNGLEIMKLNNSVGSLSVSNSAASSPSSVSSSESRVGIIAGVGAFAVLLGVTVVFIMCLSRKYSSRTSKSMASNHQYLIPFLAVEEATDKFDESRVIGIGGFGKVYRGVLNDGTKVAVKRGSPKSQQGLAEFQTEIEMLSRFRHRHLVSLIGYCDEKNEMILVYEYMENGTLRSHLYGSGLASLSWKQRLEACIGAARGLHYLHTGFSKVVIHRDVKSANILLDENLRAKVADFGLSKTGHEIDRQSYVSTAVKGTFGYLDPEYCTRQQLTEKSDVYSFGVVLLEVVCARPVIDPTKETVNLAEWAMKWQAKGQLDQIIDSNLVGKIRPESLRKFGETAEKCLARNGVDRPSMGNVLCDLEYALQLQEAVIHGEAKENSINNVDSNVSRVEMTDLDYLSGVSGARVFSQLAKPEGR